MEDYIPLIIYLTGVLFAAIINTIADWHLTVKVNNLPWDWKEKKEGERPHVQETFSLVLLSVLVVLYKGIELRDQIRDYKDREKQKGK